MIVIVTFAPVEATPQHTSTLIASKGMLSGVQVQPVPLGVNSPPELQASAKRTSRRKSLQPPPSTVQLSVRSTVLEQNAPEPNQSWGSGR